MRPFDADPGPFTGRSGVGVIIRVLIVATIRLYRDAARGQLRRMETSARSVAAGG
jgi:hypothetical protein